VQQVIIKPLLQQTVQTGTLFYIDEYVSYTRLTELGYDHQSVCHGAGKYPQDEDGDDFHETMPPPLKAFVRCYAIISGLIVAFHKKSVGRLSRKFAHLS